MIKNFPPNIDPNTYAFTAAVAGAISSGDFDSYELYAIGNWLVLVGQYLITFAAQQQLIESRIEHNNININSRQYKNGGSPFDSGKSNQTQRMEVDYLLKVVKDIEQELKNLKEKGA